MNLYAEKKRQIVKKVYISTIISPDLSRDTIKRAKDIIRLVIFEKFGDQYYVIDEAAVAVMYQQAASLMNMAADAINAYKIIYGDLSGRNAKIEINLISLQRKGTTLVPKSIVKLPFFESQLDSAIEEAARKTMELSYKIDMKNIPSNESIELKGLHIRPIENGEISQILFKSNDESIQLIVDYLKGLISEGDEYYNKKKYDTAMDAYEDVIERMGKKLIRRNRKKL